MDPTARYLWEDDEQAYKRTILVAIVRRKQIKLEAVQKVDKFHIITTNEDLPLFFYTLPDIYAK